MTADTNSLSRYPVLALQRLSTPWDVSTANDEFSELQTLATVHSKFIALLSQRARAQLSDNSGFDFDWRTFLSELVSRDDTSFRGGDAFLALGRSGVRHTIPTELTFPAPLSYIKRSQSPGGDVSSAASSIASSKVLSPTDTNVTVPSPSSPTTYFYGKDATPTRPNPTSVQEKRSSKSFFPGMRRQRSKSDSIPRASMQASSAASITSSSPRRSYSHTDVNLSIITTRDSSFSSKNSSVPSIFRMRKAPRAPLPPRNPTTNAGVAYHRVKQARDASMASSARGNGYPRMMSGVPSEFGGVRNETSMSSVRGSMMPPRRQGTTDSALDSSATSSASSISAIANGINIHEILYKPSFPSHPSSNSASSSSLSLNGGGQGGRNTSSPVASGLEKLDLERVPNPHSLSSGSHPLFAPVYRVYVPDASPAPSAQDRNKDGDRVERECEAQLRSSGVWQRSLRVGDAVVNVGYVGEDDGMGWFIFDGRHLAKFDSTSPPPMVRTRSVVPQVQSLSGNPNLVTVDAIEAGIPCPTYYSHILPRGTNPIHALRIPTHLLALPPVTTPTAHSPFASADPEATPTQDYPGQPRHQALTFALVHLRTPVALLSGQGHVQRYIWTARCNFRSERCASELGAMWAGEWVLESEGTPEGRALLDRVLGMGAGGRGDVGMVWKWEVVLERCEGDVLWLRYVY